MNISLDKVVRGIRKIICHRTVSIGLVITVFASGLYHAISHAAEILIEPIQACVITREVELKPLTREKVAQCLGWQTDNASLLCRGSYKPLTLQPFSDNKIQIMANEVSFRQKGRSKLSGNVEVQQGGRIVNAQTAYVYRDAKTNEIKEIELFGEVQYLEEGRLIIARKAVINPQDKSGRIEDVLYRFNLQKRGAILPAWGRAAKVERFANKDYLLEKATYTTCAPQDNAWELQADRIKLNNAESRGVAYNAKLYLKNWPVLYTPYLSFPTSKERKSGFLMPIVGSTNVGGFELAIPYYFNLAPNYDLTLTPHLYIKRGLLFEGQYRYLGARSFSSLRGRFLGHDRAYSHFLHENEVLFPLLRGKPTSRWSFDLQNSTELTPDLHFGVNYQQVSDDYFLQDFSSNWDVLTQRQLIRQADLSYTTDHWFFKGLTQSYQTLHPINETPVSDTYQRLPQLSAFGRYDELPFNLNFSLEGQFDNFIFPSEHFDRPDGLRSHLNPILSLPYLKPWGFFTPSIEFVENNYEVRHQLNQAALPFNPFIHRINERYLNIPQFIGPQSNFNRFIPRYSIDSGLYFERYAHFLNHGYTQSLEPRLFFLKVPFHDQTAIPVFDSGYMIFNSDQLFRTNRFSGFDRIGDTNQLSYALSSRWLSDESGGEKASFILGQIRYFSDRKVLLCQDFRGGHCIQDPLTIGFLSPTSKFSPFVSRAVYHFNPVWIVAGDYAWDPATHKTNNGHLNFHYESDLNKIFDLGYSYLVNGDTTKVAFSEIANNALYQLTFSYSWPFTAKWSSLGGYNYNISKRYEMMSFLGLQYDSCCWAIRVIGGRVFRSLDSQANPRYNNNIYFQILLKGLGAVGNSDPSNKIRSFIPGYIDRFRV